MAMNRSKSAILAAVMGVAMAGQAGAAPITLTWDFDGAATAGTGGTGTWDTTSSLWRLTNNTGALQTWTNDGTTTAFLQSTAGTLTIASGTTILVKDFTLGTNGFIINAADSTAKLEIVNSTGSTTTRTLTINAEITGTEALTYTGTSGSWTLGGNNTYTGGTNLNGGTLVMKSANAIGTTGTISFGGGSLQFDTLNTTDYTARFSNAINQAYNFNTPVAVTLGAANLTSVGGSLTKQGVGNLTLTGTNSFTGNVTNSSPAALVVNTINNGGVAGNLGAGTIINLNGTTGIATLSYGGAGETTDRSINLGGTNTQGGAITNTGSGLLKITGSVTASGNVAGSKKLSIGGGLVELGGAISDNNTGSGFLTWVSVGGSATATLSGPSTYTGVTSIDKGNLSVSSFNSVATNVGLGTVHSASSNLGAPTTVAGGTIKLGGTGSGNLTYTGGGEITDRVIDLGATSAGQTLTQAGSGVLKFTSDFTATGAGSKALTLQGDNTAAAAEIAGAVVDNSVANTTKVIKSGTGTWTLSGNNTYTGGTSVSSSGGTLIAANTNALGNVSGSVALANNSILSLATDTIAAYNITMSNANSPTIAVGRGTSGSGTGFVDQLGTLAMGTGSVVNVIAGNNLTGGVPTLRFGVTTLSATTGSTSSTLNPVGVSVTLASVTNTATVASGKTLGLDGTSTGNYVLGVIDNGTTSNAGNVVGVNKTNTSTWTLNAVNTYTGNTTVSGGTLVLAPAASIANSAAIIVNSAGTLDVSGVTGGFAVGASQTLRGSGSVLGKVTAAGAVTPGTGGTLGTLTYNNDVTIGGSLNIDIDSDANTLAGGVDLIQGVNTLDITGSTVNFNNITPLLVAPDDGAYVFAKYTSLTGTFATVNNTPAGYSIDYNYQGGNQIALVSAIPEPATMAIMAIGGLALLRRRRSR